MSEYQVYNFTVDAGLVVSARADSFEKAQARVSSAWPRSRIVFIEALADRENYARPVASPRVSMEQQEARDKRVGWDHQRRVAPRSRVTTPPPDALEVIEDSLLKAYAGH